MIETTLVEIATIIAATLAFVFSFLTIFKINKQEKTNRTNILLISIGFLLWTLGELTWWYIYRPMEIEPSPADYLWMAGYLFVAAGIISTTLKLYKDKKQLKRGLALLTLLTIPATITLSILYATCPTIIETEQCIAHAYSIIGGMLLILLVSIFAEFKQLKKTSTPITLIMLMFLFDLIADILYGIFPHETIGIYGTIADGSYGIGYLLAAAAFYLLSRR